MSNKGKLLVVSGFSGAGKGTVLKKLLETYDNYNLSISATSRSPRTGEVDGREYFFKTVDEFEDMIKNGELLEYARYVGNYYGTPKSYVVSQLEAGNNCLLEIETVGALNVKKLFPEAKLVFICPPSAVELKNRLVGRGTEDEATINARLSKAALEADGVAEYDYIVVNNTVEKCVEDVNGIAVDDEATCESCLSENNKEFINQLKEELKVFAEGEE